MPQSVSQGRNAQPPIATLSELLPRLARAFPDKIALITDDAALSYSELNRRAAALAASLSARGVAPGDRVSLLSQNRWEWIVSYHAALQLGAVVNPLNAMLTADEFEYVSADAGSNVLIASTEHLATVAASLPRLDSLRLVVVFEATAGASKSGAARSDAASGTIEHVPFSELLRPAQPEFSPVAVAPDELACIAYTSGTTGHPKGTMQTQRSLLLNCAYTATMHGRSAADNVVTALPATHVYGNMAIHSVLLVGGTVVLMSRFDAGRALALIDQHRATLIDGVPAMYAMMLADPGLETADLSTLTRSIVGGQVIAPSVVERWEARTGAPLIELWGMTELSGLGTTHAQHAPNVHGSIGVALPGVEARVADVADPRRTCAVDEPGELVIRGPIVMQGYHNNPVATAKAIDDEGWLHTGDVVTRGAAGHFFVVDRLTDMILTAGYNVYPAEIERVLMGHENVTLVAVGRAEDQVKGEVAHAYIVPTDPANADKESVLAYARERLSAYKVPRAIHFVKTLPTTSSGKLMRRALRPET